MVSMRRIGVLVLSMLLIVTMLVPSWAFAQTEEEKGLENVIKIIKRKFDIPEGCKFEYYDVYENQKGEKTWNLGWYDKEKEIRLNVSTTEDGKIVYYGYNEPYKEQERKFPKVAEEQALGKAEDFIRQISPAGTLSRINRQDIFQNPIFNRDYYFNYYRVVDGIPFYQDNVYVSVNSETGKIYYYNYNIDDKLVFSSTKKVISAGDAEKTYTEKLGLELIYKYDYDYRDDKINIFSAYVPNYSNDTYAIDAITGERIRMDRYGIFGSGNMGLDEDAAILENKKYEIQKAAGVVEEPRLTPEEMEAVKKQAELLTEKEAELIAREIPGNDLGEDFLLTSWNLSRGWPIKDELIYNMNFRKEINDERTRYLYADVGINAKTGEIVRFYLNHPYTEEKPKVDEDKAKAAVENHLNKISPDKFKEVELKEVEEDIYVSADPEKEPQRFFSFDYVRKVNDIPFPGNGFYMVYDAVYEKVTNYSVTWFDVDFPGLDDTITDEDAYKALYENIGLELQYRQIYYEDDLIPIPKIEPTVEETNETTEIKLVYLLKTGKPYILDANTGNVLNYDGKPFKEDKPIEYTDIEEHYAKEKIEELVKYKIINFADSEYRPSDVITQKDYFSLLVRIMDRYYGPVIMEDSSEDEINEMYKQLIREGIVEENEVDPESCIIREDGVKFFIRVLKYDKVADIPKIFKLSFLDASDINPRLLGYVAIANGLGIITGDKGRFKPKGDLTRADAAIMMHNYLNRYN